jgi:hypothetical protein
MVESAHTAAKGGALTADEQCMPSQLAHELHHASHWRLHIQHAT